MESIAPFKTADDIMVCNHCKTENASDKKFCTQCRFPISGTEEEQKRFHSDIAKNKILLKDAEEQIKKAKNIIYILAAFSVLTGAILFFTNDDTASLVVYLLICILYLGLAAWCSSNPFGAILTAFIVYVTLQVVIAFINPASIASGIVLKIVFIGAFIKGIQSASEARTFMRELEKAKVEPVGAYY